MTTDTEASQEAEALFRFLMRKWGLLNCPVVGLNLCLCFEFVAEQQLVGGVEVGPIQQEARHQFTDLGSVSSGLLKVRFNIGVDRVLSSLEPLPDITSSFSQ